VELQSKREPREALPYFLRATALDADFTMAWLSAASAYGTRDQRADSILQTLNVRRAQLAPLDRLLLDFELSFDGGDRPGALEAMHQVLEIAPGSTHLWQAGALALRLNRPREAIELLTQVDPESGWMRGWVLYWTRLTRTYHELGDYEAEVEALDRMRHLHPNAPGTLAVEIRVLGAGGRIDELGPRIREGIQRSTGRALFLNGIPFRGFGELHAHGYPEAASSLVDSTLEWFENRTSDWRQDPGQSYVYAQLLDQAGRWDESEAILDDLVEAVPFGGPEHNNTALELAYVLANQGKRDQAFSAVGLTGRSNSLTIRAWVEAALGERERAMELLRERGREFDMHELGLSVRFESLRDYPPFVEEFVRPQG
jgi:tetratricopeptide (TPR) repeat protein